ncbi:MAG: CRTAC1 family protein [Saprospiraceae bacterium]|nr:CRTAC1 family protein [Saprospiraceae bacterium]
MTTIKKSINKSLSLFLLITILYACSGETVQIGQDINSDPRDASTIEMAAELKQWNDYLTPDKSNYKNRGRSQMFVENAKMASGIQKLTFDLRSEYELLLAGQSQRAYQGFNRIDSLARAMGIPEDQPVYLMTKEFRALAMLRLGEQENCLHNHSIESCIMPFGVDSYHQLTKGSETAIDEIEGILQLKEDLNFRYVLNVAYMTLGRYPQDVPKQWLLPMTFTEEKDILENGKFDNISSLIGIDDNRLSGGVVIEDFDNDLDLDIMVSSWNLNDQIFYYENDGNGNFENKYKSAGLEGLTGGLNMSHGDYNNDGYMDVFVTRGAWLPLGTFPNSLLRNNGDGSFTDVTKASGIYSLHPCQTAVWADFNNDGWLDIFVGNESYAEFVHPCELWLNDGQGNFTNVAAASKANISAFIKGASASDYDKDGDIDLYLSNMAGGNFLLKNNFDPQTKAFVFENSSTQAGVLKPDQSFPCWFFDANNDGWDDIFVSAFPYNNYNNFAGGLAMEMLGQENGIEKPKIYINNQDGTFSDMTASMGLNTTCYTMGSNYGDINNDGYMDFYLGTGEPDFKALVPNRMFLNRQGRKFSEVTTQGGFGHVQKGHAVSFADLDNDGHQDVYAVMGGAYEGDVFFNAFFHNPGNDNDWIKFDITGTQSNRPAYGTQVELQLTNGNETKSYYQTVSNSSSFGENPRWLHFGIPNGMTITKAIVNYPSGQKQSFDKLNNNTFYAITEGDDVAVQKELKNITLNKDSHHHHH